MLRKVKITAMAFGLAVASVMVPATSASAAGVPSEFANMPYAGTVVWETPQSCPSNPGGGTTSREVPPRVCVSMSLRGGALKYVALHELAHAAARYHPSEVASTVQSIGDEKLADCVSYRWGADSAYGYYAKASYCNSRSVKPKIDAAVNIYKSVPVQKFQRDELLRYTSTKYSTGSVYDAAPGSYDWQAIGMSLRPHQLRSGTNYSKDWQSIASINFRGDDRDEVMFYDKSKSTAAFYDVSSTGSLTKKITKTGWKDWDIVTSVDLQGDGRDELLFYRASNGFFQYYSVDSSAGIHGPILEATTNKRYSPGWTSITSVDLNGDGRDEIMFYNSETGRSAYYRLDSKAQLSTLRKYNIDKGWTSITNVDLNGDGQDEMMFYRASDGLVKYYMMKSNGSLGSRIAAPNNQDLTVRTFSSIVSLNIDED